MIITRTPFRISFVGGGSDLEAYYSKSPGAVLSTTINQYMYISSHKFFEKDKIRVKYSQTETVDRASDIQHPILRTILSKFNLTGIEVSSIADVPSGTGMGSSSSFTVGVLHNIYTVLGKEVSKEQLAQEACEIEIDILKEPIGKQDQYAAAYGGLNIFRFNTDGSVITEPINLPSEIILALEKNLVMFYIGNQRKASDILTEQKKNTGKEDKFNTLQQMVRLVDELKNCLIQGTIDEMGKILHENWLLKQQLASAISNPEINSIYQTALENGATGGKLLGAGGGGFMLFYCKPEYQTQLKKALQKLQPFDFAFEYEGSKVIYRPE
ncbi:MAG: GHMP kinase [Flavobacteriales bacterium]|nr:GHMP kinase [Flavobacteriales bacterium]